MPSPKVTIIIPVFNVSRYVEECLYSVVNQTYTDIEAILIDDCGTDNSMAIAEQFINQYEGPIQFRVLRHEKNRGLSAARNTGIDAAKGEYIFFLDSDDWISSDCIELMLHAIEVNVAEMVMGGIAQEDGFIPWGAFTPEGSYSDGIIQMACSYNIYTMAWNKLFHRQFLLSNGLYFKEGLYHEDVLWNIQVACNLHKFVSIEEKTYHYRIRQGSIQNKTEEAFHYMHLSDAFIELLRYVFECGLEGNVCLYSYISKEMDYFLSANEPKDVQTLRNDFYRKFRQSPYWSLRQLRRMRVGKKTFLLSLNRILPKQIGLKYYSVMHRWLYR